MNTQTLCPTGMNPLLPEVPTYCKDAVLNPQLELPHIPQDKYPVFILIPLINAS